jgi:multidrug efflux system membrane fusion protein
VELPTVTVARSNGEEAVIKAGLKPGETVVTDGQLRLVPGSRINVKESTGADSAQKVTS